MHRTDDGELPGQKDAVVTQELFLCERFSCKLLKVRCVSMYKRANGPGKQGMEAMLRADNLRCHKCPVGKANAEEMGK